MATHVQDINVGSLLRFFKSEFFTPWIRVSYLYKYTNPGIHDYICNSLYSMAVDDIEYYLIQIMYVDARRQPQQLHYRASTWMQCRYYYYYYYEHEPCTNSCINNH
jgi:hypothetical protein